MSGAHEYKIGEAFGSEPENYPRLDAITLRQPPPPDPNFWRCAEKRQAKKLSLRSREASPNRKATLASGPGPVSEGMGLRDGGAFLLLLGLVIVAIVLFDGERGARITVHTKTELPLYQLERAA